MTYEEKSEIVIRQLREDRDRLQNAIEQIRAEIERLHYHPKLDFIKNDEVVEMALEVIDKYREEQICGNTQVMK